MIRPFSLRDVALLRRLRGQGTLLQAEAALTQSCQPLRGALFSMVGGDATTYVWRAEDGNAAGFAQLRLSDDQARAHLVCLGVTPVEHEDSNGSDAGTPLNEDAWLSILDNVVTALGQRGVHSVVAEVDESGPELPLLRRAGFAVYTRQDIWALVEERDQKVPLILEPRQTSDEWDVEWLYANTVPPLIQLVEPSPPEGGNTRVLREEGELTAFIHIHTGPAASWLQIFIHPNAYAQANEIVAAAVSACAPHPAFPVYCCVRRYQSWLKVALEQSGFRPCQSQAVMVKHIASPIRNKISALDKLLYAQGARPTTLLQRYHAADDGTG
jgi:hypothetical protein